MKREQDNIGMLRKHLMVVENGNTTAIPDHILTRTTSRSENRTERKESRPGQAGGGGSIEQFISETNLATALTTSLSDLICKEDRDIT